MRNPFKEDNRPPYNLRIVFLGVTHGPERNPARKNNYDALWAGLIAEYRSDLGYPVPYTFDIRPWRSRGIWIYPQNSYKTTIEDFTQMRYLSVRYPKLVFIAIGSVTGRLLKYVDQRKHFVIRLDHPARTHYVPPHLSLPPVKGSKFYTRVCEYLHAPKHIFKLPVKAPGKRKAKNRSPRKSTFG